MLFFKFAIIVFCVALVLVPVSIYMMLKWGNNIGNTRWWVKKQYPSLFHRGTEENNS